MKKDKKKKKFEYKELLTNKQYRSILILVFYAILFTIVIISIRMPSEEVTNASPDVVTKLKGYELIDNKNFSYKYTVMVDENTYIFEGNKYGDEELLTLTKDDEQKKYYFNDDKIYVLENNVYRSIINKPIIVFDFFNTDIIDQLIIRSVLIDENANRYKIDNQSLYDVLNDTSERVDSGENYITLGYRNSNITKIVFEIDNYSRLVGDFYKKVVICLEYYDFNLIEKFENITVE